MPAMTAADGVFLLILVSSLFFGARRGFYKEVVHLLAVLVGIWLALRFRGDLSTTITGATGLPPFPAQVLAFLGLWIGGFLVSAVVGRLLLKKLRGKGVDDRLDDGAEAIADVIGGDTTKGPITKITDKVAGSGKRGLFYWSDKLLGMGLGVVKGAISAYALFGLVLWADRLGWESSFARSVEGSLAIAQFERHFSPFLQAIPEYRIGTSVEEMRGIRDAVKEDPRRVEKLVEHEQLRALKNDPRVTEAANDPEVRRLWAERDMGGLLLNPKIQALLGDPEVRKRVAEVDWARVRADVEGKTPPKPEAPPPPGPPK